MHQSKKNAENSVELLKSIQKKKPQSPNTSLNNSNVNTTRRNLSPGYIRVSMYFSDNHLKKLKNYAYWQRLSVKQIIEVACMSHLDPLVHTNTIENVHPIEDSFIRTTIVMKESDWEKVKEAAWRGRVLTKFVFAYILEKFFEGKETPPRPIQSIVS